MIKHNFLIHLHLLDPSEVVKTLAFQALVSTPPSGVQQMLMLRKTCLIPIFTSEQELSVHL